MCNAPAPGFMALLVPIFLFAASCASSGDGKTESGTQKRYASPTAVFDAYRKARDKHAARMVFSLLTPQAQSDAVFETFFACAEQGSQEMGPIVPKYVDLATLGDDYEKQYKKKHGVDLAKLQAEHKNDPTFVPPSQDEQLWRDVVAAHIKDKAGFYEAVAKHFDERDAKRHEEKPVSPLGDLEQVVVQDDTATGHAATLGFHYETPPGKPTQKVEDRIDKTFKFRRINGGWLMDSL